MFVPRWTVQMAICNVQSAFNHPINNPTKLTSFPLLSSFKHKMVYHLLITLNKEEPSQFTLPSCQKWSLNSTRNWMNTQHKSRRSPIKWIRISLSSSNYFLKSAKNTKHPSRTPSNAICRNSRKWHWDLNPCSKRRLRSEAVLATRN